MPHNTQSSKRMFLPSYGLCSVSGLFYPCEESEGSQVSYHLNRCRTLSASHLGRSLFQWGQSIRNEWHLCKIAHKARRIELAEGLYHTLVVLEPDSVILLSDYSQNSCGVSNTVNLTGKFNNFTDLIKFSFLDRPI